MKKLILLLMVIGFVSVAGASTKTIWNPAANGITPPTPGFWADGNNWLINVPNPDPCLPDIQTYGTIPDALDGKAVFNVPGAAEAWVTGTQTMSYFVQGDGADGGVIRVKPGGTLTTGVHWAAVGYNSTAHMIIEAGGTVNFGQHAWIGLNDGSVGTVDINGGLMTVGQMLGLGWSNDVLATSQGFININDGGTLDLFQMHGDGAKSVQHGSLITINGTGQILLPGDYTAVIAAYYANGLITSDLGAVQVTIDGSGNSIVTSAVIPEPATMMLLGLGAVLLRRKR